jgi:hypothetical protein
MFQCVEYLGRTVTAVCDESGRTKCDWINLPYKINVASVEVSYCFYCIVIID